MKSYLKKNWIYITAIIIPWLISLVRCAVSGAWIFGNGSILSGDAVSQILPFYYELWNSVHGGGLSHFTGHIAGGIPSNSIYGVLVSPLSLIVLLLPKSMIHGTLQFVMIAKWSVLSYTMVYFFYNTKLNTLENSKEAVSLFLGLAFTLNNGMTNFVGYPQLNDVLICFPILMLLLERMLKEGKWKLYVLILSLCMLSNLYMIFGMCIILLVWFGYLNIEFKQDDYKYKWKVFVGSSLLAAVNAAGLIMSNAAMLGGRVGFGSNEENLNYIKAILISPVDFMKQLFFLTPVSDGMEMSPNIYYSVAAVYLTIIYIFIKMDIKKKLYLGITGIIIMLSFFFGCLSYIWHCFTFPHGLNHRFSNYFIFILLIMILKVLESMKSVSLKHVLAAGAAGIIMYVAAFMLMDSYNSFVGYLVTFLLIVLYMMIAILYTKKSISYRSVLVIFSVFGMAELMVNSFFVFNTHIITDDSRTMDNRILELTDGVELQSGERIACPDRSNVGALAYKDSDDGYVSGTDDSYRAFHTGLGMDNSGYDDYGLHGASPLINLIFNLRYVVGHDGVEVSDADIVDGNDEWSIYRTNRLAGVGYMVQSFITNWDIAEGNCFYNQNAFVSLALGEDIQIFEDVIPDMNCTNSIGDVIENDEEASENNAYEYSYDHLASGDGDYTIMSWSVEEDMDLYMYMYSDNSCNTIIFVDDTIIHVDENGAKSRTYHIGKLKKGQNVSVYRVISNAALGMSDSFRVCFARFDESIYNEVYERLSNNVMEVDEYRKGYIKGYVDVDNGGILMTSVPNINGMSVYVDGRKAYAYSIGDALIGIKVTKGRHMIELQYRPVGQVLGSIVMCIGWLVYVGLCYADHNRKREVSE